MEMQAAEAARRWLVDQGVRQARDGWVSDERPDVLLTTNQVAQSWAGDVFAEDLDAADQLRLAFGLLDLRVAEQSEARLRRARRVLECSGPVRWTVKEPTYRTAVRLPALHSALCRGLRAGFHDVYGDLEPRAALALLDQLDLPTDTQHLAELRHVLAAGHKNHYRGPGAWDDAVRSCSGAVGLTDQRKKPAT
ncbi:hypothetical protein [Streptomyces sp. NPDC052015]|uniref:hypothetical protein n=1 Tax=Streptomyces sp. NPDC052015 TaxID=3154755 RepID=UPI0034159935